LIPVTHPSGGEIKESSAINKIAHPLGGLPIWTDKNVGPTHCQERAAQ